MAVPLKLPNLKSPRRKANAETKKPTIDTSGVNVPGVNEVPEVPDTSPTGPSHAKNRRPPRIEVRQFAGHLDHAERLSRPLKVAHMTDLHVGRVTPMRVQHHAVDLVNAGTPDVIALTGDFVCHSQLYLDALYETLVRLEAPAFAVLGNHDHWSGADEVRAVLRRAGVEVLDNANTTITISGERLQVVGIDDAYTCHADKHQATKGLDHRLPTLGLSHIAEEADVLWDKGVPLVLSGHTHAGQITLARLHEIAIGRLGGHKYVHGMYGQRDPTATDAQESPRGAVAPKGAEAPKGAVYVGAGIGASVMPLRVGDRGRREVTFFELGAEPGAIVEHHAEQPAFSGRVPTEKQKEKRRKKVEARKKKRLKKSKR